MMPSSWASAGPMINAIRNSIVMPLHKRLLQNSRRVAVLSSYILHSKGLQVSHTHRCIAASALHSKIEPTTVPNPSRSCEDHEFELLFESAGEAALRSIHTTTGLHRPA